MAKHDEALLNLRKYARDLSSVAQTVATIAGAASGLTAFKPTWDSRKQAKAACLAYLEDLNSLMVKVCQAARDVSK